MELRDEHNKGSTECGSPNCTRFIELGRDVCCQFCLPGKSRWHTTHCSEVMLKYQPLEHDYSIMVGCQHRCKCHEIGILKGKQHTCCIWGNRMEVSKIGCFMKPNHVGPHICYECDVGLKRIMLMRRNDPQKANYRILDHLKGDGSHLTVCNDACTCKRDDHPGCCKGKTRCCLYRSDAHHSAATEHLCEMCRVFATPQYRENRENHDLHVLANVHRCYWSLDSVADTGDRTNHSPTVNVMEPGNAEATQGAQAAVTPTGSPSDEHWSFVKKMKLNHNHDVMQHLDRHSCWMPWLSSEKIKTNLKTICFARIKS